MKTNTVSVKTLVKKIVEEKERVHNQKLQTEKRKRILAEKLIKEEKGAKLIKLFEYNFFSMTSSNKKVAQVIANMEDYYTLTWDSSLIYQENNTIFREYLDNLAKKFNITIHTYTKKFSDYSSGSGDDMVYYSKPSEIRVVFSV